MLNKNQIIVFIVSFLIAGFFVLSIPESGFPGGSILGGPPCCNILGPECIGGQNAETICNNCISQQLGCTFFPNGECIGVQGGEGQCAPPIPTLNQWGMFIMAGALGLFALIALRIMRRRNEVKPSS